MLSRLAFSICSEPTMRRMSAKFLVCMLAVPIGCKTEQQGGGNVGAADTGVIKVSDAGSMTGAEATFGNSSDGGIQLAVTAGNSEAAINGPQLQVIAPDVDRTAEEAATA